MSTLADGFTAWQAADWVHPLTCSGGGGPGDHTAELVLRDDCGDTIVLACPVCGFTQVVLADSHLGRIINAGPPADPLARFRAVPPSGEPGEGVNDG